MGTQVLVFLFQPGEAAEKEPGEVGVGQSKGKKRSKSRNWEPEPCSHWTPEPHCRVSEQAVQKPRCQGGVPPFFSKVPPLHLIAASSKQFFQISSDLRSSECVELKKHQDHNYGYYRELLRAHHHSIWL